MRLTSISDGVALLEEIARLRIDEDDNLDDGDVDGPTIDGEVLMSANRRKLLFL